MSNIFIGLKKTCLGVLDRRERGDDNATGLKEGGRIEMSIYSAFHYAMHAPSLKYSPSYFSISSFAHATSPDATTLGQ